MSLLAWRERAKLWRQNLSLPRRAVLTMVLAAIASWLCVPPMPLGPAILLVLPWMLWELRKLTTSQAAVWGLGYGIVFHVLTLHWIRNVMSVGPVVAIGFGLLLLAVYLSLFTALWAAGWARLANKGRWYLWPLLFSGIELVRGFGQMSFPWLHIGYDFGQILPLLQPVAFTGVYGLGFLLALSASLVAVVWEGKISKRWLLAPAGFWAAWLGLGFWSLATPTPAGGMRVAVIQPAVPQTRKWEESYFQTVIDKALHTADRLPKVPYDLIVFPETAIPDYWSWRLLEAARFQRLADSSGATVVLGALEGIADPSLPAGGRMYNSAFVLRPWSQPQRYDKLRLVPFSEHLPFENVFPVLNYVQLGQSSFSAGDSLPVINSVVPWSPSICYEMVYPDFARLSWHHGSRLLVNLTNDGWFGRSAGPYQHWNIQRFRAIEAGMPLIRSANTGISGVVDAQGRELAISTLMTDTVLVATVPAGHGSFAGRFGGWIELFLGLGGVLALGVAGKPRAKVPESVT